MGVHNAAFPHQAYHLLEMQQFFARELRHFFQQLQFIDILVQQVHRSGGGFLFAVGVINQQYRLLGQRSLHPGVGCCTTQKGLW